MAGRGWAVTLYGFLSRDSRGTATVTSVTGLPWSGRHEIPEGGIYADHVRSPGYGGYATSSGMESPLPVLHASELDAGLWPFSTPSMDPHVRGTPPGFSVPLTSRERLARAVHLGGLLPGHEEPAHTYQGLEWPLATAMINKSLDRVSSSHGAREPHNRSSLPFASKISLVREILGD